MSCVSCGSPLEHGVMRCPTCGTAQPSLAPPPPPPPPPPAPGSGAPLAAGRPTATTAVVSLIAGIVGVTALPLAGSIVAVITGHLARKEVRESMGRLEGEGLATGGLVLGYVGLVLGCVAPCVLVMMFGGLAAALSAAGIR